MDKALPVNKEEPMIRWSQVEVDIDGVSSISSEDEGGSEYDNEQRARPKPSQEIWNTKSLWEELLTLPDAEEIHNLVLRDDFQLLHSKDKTTAILLVSWIGKINILMTLLDSGISPNSSDENGRTALHWAAFAGKADCLRLLLERGGNIHQWDFAEELTPLHCSAGMGHWQCVRSLIKCGADVNAGITNKSPLYYAVQSGAIACVKELLEHKASPNTPQVFSETPLHIATSLGFTDIIKLLIEHGAAVNVQCGTDKMTPLHLAAEDGDARTSKMLIDAGALVSSRNRKRQMPLHLAALSQSSETLELLLRKGADPNASDVDGRTPLHSSIVKVSRSLECVKMLINAKANVNKADIFGYTALHLAALNEFSHCVMLLINNGGDVTMRTNGGVSVLTFITRKTPDVIPKYIGKFDASIKKSDHELGDVDCELKLDFRVLVPTMGHKETELLLNFIEVGHKEVLKHPLCETFLFLKWRRIRKFFLFSLIFHALFVQLFTIYIIGVFLKNCPSAKSSSQVCFVPTYIRNIGYGVLVLNMFFLAKEVFQIAHSWRMYIKQWENWLQWLIIISIFACVQPVPDMNIKQDVYNWQHHIAAIAIFLAWVEMMMIVSRFPIFGLYIQMFTTVSINFSKFMLGYFFLFIAFALSFGVIFANYPAFWDLKWVLLKVIIMMSGELEYEDVFFPDEEDYSIRYPYTAHLMYLCFVVLVTVILNNLMVGLAVSDIQGLQQSAGLNRVVRQAELVAHLESMLFSKLLQCVPHKLIKFLHNQALLIKSQYHWALYIRPNDPREARIPRDLVQSIYQLVVERKERPRHRKSRISTDYCSDVYAQCISRIGSTNSNNNKQLNLKLQLEEIKEDFMEFNKMMRQKMEKLSNQLLNQN